MNFDLPNPEVVPYVGLAEFFLITAKTAWFAFGQFYPCAARVLGEAGLLSFLCFASLLFLLGSKRLHGTKHA